MKPNSFQTRGIYFALLFGPPRAFTRQDAVAVYDAVCKALVADDLQLNFGASPAPTSPVPAGPPGKPFSIVLRRPVGSGMFVATIDSQAAAAPVRLLIEHTYPQSFDSACQDLDLVTDACFDALGGQFQRVLAEVRLRGQTEASDANAVSFMTERVLRMARSVGNLEAPPDFASVTLETPARDPAEGDALRGPRREMRVEVLRNDPRSLYIELVSQWPQIAAVPAADGSVEIDPARVRSFEEKPSEYVRNAREFLDERFFPMLLGS